MSRAVEAYSEYRNSGVEWLGEVPAHWKMRKIRQCASISGGMTPSMEDGRFWNGDVPWVTPKDMKTIVVNDSHLRVTDAALAETPLQLLQAPAVLMVVRGMILARRVPIARTTAPVTINQDMKALRPCRTLNAAYLASFLGCAHDGLFPLIDEAGHGTRRLPTERWRDLPLTLPPLAEQTAISRFLDYVDRDTRRVVRKKEKLIALLEEQEQAVIHQAVTGQVDVQTGQPYPAYQDSGAKWLGQVPAHWKVRKIRQCASISGGLTPSMEDRRFWNGDVPWVTPKDMKTMVIDDSRLRVTKAALAKTPLRLVQAPAVLMVVRGMILARKVPIARTSVPVTINQDMKALRPRLALQAPYLASFLDCAHGGLFPLIDEAGHGTRRLPTERWRDLPMTVPPQAEQTAISRYLDHITTGTAAGIEQTRGQIALLREWRERLATDVVTGKLDVRNAAGSLPRAACSA